MFSLLVLFADEWNRTISAFPSVDVDFVDYSFYFLEIANIKRSMCELNGSSALHYRLDHRFSHPRLASNWCVMFTRDCHIKTSVKNKIVRCNLNGLYGLRV